MFSSGVLKKKAVLRKMPVITFTRSPVNFGNMTNYSVNEAYASGQLSRLSYIGSCVRDGSGTSPRLRFGKQEVYSLAQHYGAGKLNVQLCFGVGKYSEQPGPSPGAGKRPKHWS